MKEQIFLVSTVNATDDYGDPSPTAIQTERIATVKSISQTEFYQASASGLKPEIKFVLEDFRDYDGQKAVIYDGVEYRVLRTYHDGKKLEITCYTQVNN